jgi:hypothetical protein
MQQRNDSELFYLCFRGGGDPVSENLWNKDIQPLRKSRPKDIPAACPSPFISLQESLKNNKKKGKKLLIFAKKRIIITITQQSTAIEK